MRSTEVKVWVGVSRLLIYRCYEPALHKTVIQSLERNLKFTEEVISKVISSPNLSFKRCLKSANQIQQTLPVNLPRPWLYHQQILQRNLWKTWPLVHRIECIVYLYARLTLKVCPVGTQPNILNQLYLNLPYLHWIQKVVYIYYHLQQPGLEIWCPYRSQNQHDVLQWLIQQSSAKVIIQTHNIHSHSERILTIPPACIFLNLLKKLSSIFYPVPAKLYCQRP